jgi:hypothetical protein
MACLPCAQTAVPIEVDRMTSQNGRGFALDFGASLALERWDFGFGTDVTPRFGVDVAAFGTSANIERRRAMALAVSLRFKK